MGRKGGVMLYTTSTSQTHLTTYNWIDAHRLPMRRAWVFGGTVSFPSAQEAELRTLLE